MITQQDDFDLFVKNEPTMYYLIEEHRDLLESWGYIEEKDSPNGLGLMYNLAWNYENCE